MNSLNSLNSLPDLATYHIFKYLDVMDLLACRLVSRRFRYFADQVKLRELVIGDKDFVLQNDNRCWYFTKEPVGERNGVLISDLSQMQVFPLNINGLRRLIIALPLNSFEPAAKFLNQLTKLKQLEIVDLEDLLKNEMLTVALPELESICVGEVNFYLTLDCPALKSVFCDSGFNNIKFVHRESIERLIIDIFYWDEQYSDTFENVRYFQLNWCDTLSRQFLKCLPNVREIRMQQKYKEDIDQYAEAEENMNFLIEQRAKQGKIETLRIFYEDVEMVGSEKFGSYQFYLDFGLDYADVYLSGSEFDPRVCEHCGLIHTDDSDDSLIDSDIESEEDQSSGEESSGHESLPENSSDDAHHLSDGERSFDQKASSESSSVMETWSASSAKAKKDQI